MKSVLLSTRPKWCEKICHEIGKDENGKPIYEKRIEVRKTAPKEVPFKVLIYATRPKKFYKCGAVSTSDELLWLANGKVEMGDGFKFWADGDEYQCLNGRIIGEFVCDKVEKYSTSWLDGEDRLNETACLDDADIMDYMNGYTDRIFYAWHISDLKIYDKPKPIMQFYKPCPIEWKNCPVCELYSKYTGCCMNNITRPPQSYMYVEEIYELTKN